MKTFNFIKTLLPALAMLFTTMQTQAQEQEIIRTNVEGKGREIILTVTSGKEHNHPMMAAWLEDMDGNFLQTIYVNQSVAKGYFAYAENNNGSWQPGAVIRPASLPVWAHKRGIKSDEGHFMPTLDNPVPDAYTSATPPADFSIISKAEQKISGKVKIFFEINQSWDWNEYWTNSKFPDDADYKTSSQPSVVYSAIIDFDKPGEVVFLKAIGHGHYSGKDGDINTDQSTLTTALQIVDEVSVVVE